MDTQVGSEELDKLREQLETLQDKYDQQSTANTSLTQANDNLTELNKNQDDEIAKLKKQLEDCPPIHEHAELADKLQNESDDLKKQLELSNQDNDKLKALNKNLDDEIAKLKKQLEDCPPIHERAELADKLQNESDDLKKQLELSNQDNDNLKALNKNLDDEIAKLKKQLEDCPPIHERVDLADKLQNEIDDLKKQLELSNQDNDNLKALNKNQDDDIAKLKKQLEDCPPIHERAQLVEQLQDENDDLKKQLELAIQDKNLREQLEELQRKLSLAEEQAAEKQKWQDEAEHWKNKCKALQDRIIDLECTNGDLDNNLKKLLERIIDLECYIGDLENKLSTRIDTFGDNEELDKLREQLEELQRKLSLAEEQAAEKQKWQDEAEYWKNKCKELEDKINEQDEANKKLQSKNEELSTTIDDLNATNKNLEDEVAKLKKQLEDFPPVHERADMVDGLQNEIDDLKKQLELEAAEKQKWQEEAEYWKNKCKEYEQLAEQYNNMRQQFEDEQEKNKGNLEQIQLLEEELAALKQNQDQEPPPPEAPKEEDNMDALQNLDQIDAANYEQEIVKIKEMAVRDNDLLKRVANLKGEKPMQRLNVWKLFETLMDKKFEQDTKDLAVQIIPRPMTQFAIEYLIQQYGVKTLATKVLAQLLLALKQLNEQDHLYGNLFCRFLQIYHPDPIDKILATFLTKIRIQFNEVIKKYLTKKSVVGEKTKAPAQSWGQDNYELLEVGGIAPLLDVFELMFKFFESDKELGSNIMNRLLPSDKNKTEFSLLVLNYKIQKTGKKPQEIYEMIDKEGKGELQIQEFLNGMKTKLDMWISEEECLNISNFLDADNTGDVTTSEFVEKINVLKQKYKNKDAWMCSKAVFLTAICDEYDAKRIRDFHKLRKCFTDCDEDGNGTLELKEFENLCRKLESDIEMSRIEEMFKSAISITKNEDPNVMSPEAFALIAQKFNLGGSGTGIFDASKILSGVAREEEEVQISQVGQGKAKIGTKTPVSTRKSVVAKPGTAPKATTGKTNTTTPGKTTTATTTKTATSRTAAKTASKKK